MILVSEYKCISCGEVKESKKICSCPVCGYRMFEMPYDRAELLKKEIKEFVLRLRLTELSDDSLIVYRKVDAKNTAGDEEAEIITKEEDDERFPTFDRIQRYVCASTKTEMFCERLNESIAQIRQHIHTAYSQRYQLDTDVIIKAAEEMDETLVKTLALLDVHTMPLQFELPTITVDYCEEPDATFLPIADALLDDALELSQKIWRFIKQNNIYGTAYRDIPQSEYDAEGEEHSKELLHRQARLKSVLKKQYVVDLLSDGYDELSEMLNVLWAAIEAVMLAPVLAKKYKYAFADGMVVLGDEIKTEVLRRVHCCYLVVDEELHSAAFLADKSETGCFELYNRMIELDSYGILGVNKKKLFRIGENERKLNELIGLAGIKESIKKIKAYALMNKDSGSMSLHMCFLGNPGSGKTEVARLIADILYENGILPKKKFVEVDRSGLVSQYFGATAEKTSQVIKRAMGGVLFIDEAYALGNNADGGGITDYGKEAIDTLVKAMEDHRGEICVILAGYRNEMQKMMEVNPGFKSRIQFTLDFPNYSREELREIALLMLGKRDYAIGEAALNRILDITDIKRKEPNFANAREIRNILDQVIMCQNLRCAGTNDKEIGLVDVNRYIQDAKIYLPKDSAGSNGKVISGEEELEQLVGLETVKRMVRKIKAYAKRNQGLSDFNLHMCFYGNPGTGKTEVARILSRILYDAGVMDEAKLVETDAHGLIGKYVGETAPKTLQKIDEAMGGVLFIDEAYALTTDASHDGGNTSYGDEAIAVLLKEMEDRRGHFCAIFAGYKNEMKEMLGSNPGMESRIQFTLEFPDYTRDELQFIALSFLKKKKYSVSDDAMSLLLNIFEYYRQQPNFANARTVRNVLDQVIMNQNLRTEDEVDSDLIIKLDVEDYLSDEGIDLNGSSMNERKIGFS